MAPDGKKSKRRARREELAALVDPGRAQGEAIAGAKKQLRTAAKVAAIFLVVLWAVSVALTSGLDSLIPLYVAVALTIALAVAAVLIRRNLGRSQELGAIVAEGADLSKEERSSRIAKLKERADKGDAAAVMAKAQLEMHDSPKEALATLEALDLAKAQKAIANQIRGMRAMILLNQGDCARARELADEINLDKTPDLKSRANLAGVVAEAWARSGNPIEGGQLLDKYDPSDKDFEDVKIQLLRARVFSSAHTNDLNGMKKAMRQLADVSPHLLAAFVSQKRVHPLLQQEARRRLEKSGLVPRPRIVGR